VSCSTEQDWAKLKRVLEYLRGTLDEYLVLGADDISIMKTWVDASYAVHGDMKSHTGGAVSFGRGACMSKSSKQKLNTKSSTEAELVGASDYLPYPIWAKKFLDAQGYVLDENIFYQDNQSTIRFERNGRKSCGPNSRHIDIRYFFIKDRIDIENIDVQYCPTEQMLADFFTKPLQGSLFRKFREVIMGHKHIDTLKETSPAPSQERVGEHNFVRNGTDGRKTDARPLKPITFTYADAALKGAGAA
jgi:KUP system potassium uptake protein